MYQFYYPIPYMEKILKHAGVLKILQQSLHKEVLWMELSEKPPL